MTQSDPIKRRRLYYLIICGNGAREILKHEENWGSKYLSGWKIFIFLNFELLLPKRKLLEGKSQVNIQILCKTD
jgi:hypothetical protein